MRALVSVDINKENDELQKCITIQDSIRRELKKQYGDISLHSALISMLIENLTTIEKIIIGDDVRPFSKVKKNLNILIPEYFGRLKCHIR